MQKERLRFWQIWNMSFGFLGIQFGWGLQMGNMSAIYEQLGAQPDRLPILWLAAPLTGLIVQPIVGSLSDRTWGRLGRRRPYFLAGAILASAALFVMPTSSTLWMAADTGADELGARLWWYTYIGDATVIARFQEAMRALEQLRAARARPLTVSSTGRTTP